MSKILNLSSIFRESSIDLVAIQRDSIYLNEAVESCRCVFSEYNANRADLFKTLSEASSVDEENNSFGEFFGKYKSVINKYILKLNTLVGQFSINMENLVDANKKLIDNATDIKTIPNTPVKLKVYTNLLSDEIPNINPKKAFKKEIAMLGKLLQDLDPKYGDKERAVIIATIYNSLMNEINDGWLYKVIQKIVDNDSVSPDNFAHMMYSTFCVTSEDFTITSDFVQQAKLTLSCSDKYIYHIRDCATKFVDGINDIADDVHAMLFRNKDCKVDIKTDDDGVADATYRVGQYGINQMNKFMVAKISQINELCNLYITALSIKMDCIYSYFKQLVSVLDMCTGCAVEEECEYESTMDQLQNDMYLYEADMFVIERQVNDIMLRRDYLTEADDSQATTRSLNATLDRLTDVFAKFRDSITQTFNAQIKFVSDHKKEIFDAEIPDDWTIQLYDTDSLKTFKIADYDEKHNKLLSNDQKYISEVYSKYVTPEKEGSTINSRFVDKVYSGKEEKYGDAERKDGYDFCVYEYKKACKQLDAEQERIATISKSIIGKAKTVSKEAAFMEEYFTEDSMGSSSEPKKSSTTKKDTEPETKSEDIKQLDKANIARQYADINSRVVVAVANIYIKNFKKHFAFLKKLTELDSDK